MKIDIGIVYVHIVAMIYILEGFAIESIISTRFNILTFSVYVLDVNN